LAVLGLGLLITTGIILQNILFNRRYHEQADGESDWAKNKSDQALSQLRWAEMSARNVSYDRPGQDVSSDAHQASRQVDQAQWQTRDSSSNLRSATSYEQRSENGLTSVEQQLRQALANLP
jgi:hypothetical protein